MYYAVYCSCSRNTPTCVGKTIQRRFNLARDGKHPHVRGEDLNWVSISAMASETPPRAWGRPVIAPLLDQQLGNTPTCVGKTWEVREVLHGGKKHPHVRGEDRDNTGDHLPHRETPPRAWGRPTDGNADTNEHRNTPTCVGKTPTYC